MSFKPVGIMTELSEEEIEVNTDLDKIGENTEPVALTAEEQKEFFDTFESNPKPTDEELDDPNAGAIKELGIDTYLKNEATFINDYVKFTQNQKQNKILKLVPLSEYRLIINLAERGDTPNYRIVTKKYHKIEVEEWDYRQRLIAETDDLNRKASLQNIKIAQMQMKLSEIRQTNPDDKSRAEMLEDMDAVSLNDAGFIDMSKDYQTMIAVKRKELRKHGAKAYLGICEKELAKYRFDILDEVLAACDQKQTIGIPKFQGQFKKESTQGVQ